MGNNFLDEDLLKISRMLFENFIYKLQKMCNFGGTSKHVVGTKTRQKDINSILEKLERRGYQTDCISNENFVIDNVLFDIVAGRIVCSFKGDIDLVLNNLDIIIEEFAKENNVKVEILEIRDYVKDPKASGYSSVHIILCFYIGDKKMNMELQIRSIAMDWSASVDHRLRYKKKLKSNYYDQEISEFFKYCKGVDDKMENLVKRFGIRDRKIFSIEEYPFLKSEEYKSLRANSEEALNNLEKLINSVCDGDSKTYTINPIEHKIKSVKSDARVIKKLSNKGKEISVDSIREYVGDFASFKIICPFMSELEEVKNSIKCLEETGMIKIISEDDYINTPKVNGYRGFHYFVLVPRYKDDIIIGWEKVLIQLWTPAMQMWANFEDELVYYNDGPKEELIRELKDLSDVTRNIDCYLDELYKRILKENGISRKKIQQ